MTRPSPRASGSAHMSMDVRHEHRDDDMHEIIAGRAHGGQA